MKTKQKKQKRATFSFNSELHKALRLKAEETDQSLSDLVNDAVRRGLAEDAEDLSAFKKRAGEPNLLFEDVLKQMKKRGQL